MPILEKKNARCFIAGEWESFGRAVFSEDDDNPNHLTLELFDYGSVVGRPGM